MRGFVFTVFAAAVLTLPLCAQVANFEVPFEFTVGTTSAPPGHYIMRTIAGSTMIEVMGSDESNRHFAHYLATHRDGQNPSMEPKLVFHRYANQYFLSQVWSRAFKSGLPLSHAERELQNYNVTAATRVVLATRRAN